MSSNLVIQGQALPAHIAKLKGKGARTDLTQGADSGFPVVSIKGSRFHIQAGGNLTLVKTAEGHPAPYLEVVILKANPALSKIYYADAYKDGDDDSPDCMSANGIKPDVGVKAKQANSCAICPQNVWGSKLTQQGTKTKACSDVRRVAVLAPSDLECKLYKAPYLLRVPAASLKELAALGAQLGDDVPYNAVVVVVTFDTSVAYPKLKFAPARYLSEQELELVDRWVDDPIVSRIVGNEIASGEAEAGEDAADAQAAAPAKQPATPAAPPTPASVAQAPAPDPLAWIPEHLRPAVTAMGGVDQPAVQIMLKAAGVAIPEAAPAEPEPDPMESVPVHLRPAVEAMGGLDQPAVQVMLKAAGVTVTAKAEAPAAKAPAKRRSSKKGNGAATEAPATVHAQATAPTPAPSADNASLLADIDSLIDGLDLATDDI